MSDRDDLADVIENYELIQKLGEGSFGEVWLARDKKRDERVALKYLRLERASEDYLELFKREFAILCEMRHRNLANVFDFGYSPKQQQYFFTSEFCSGKEFIEAMEGKPLSYLEEALVQALAALDYVHAEGIVHFDIKSENIIVSDEDGHPVVKILDFGVASKLKALPEGVVGTPSYMAPEIILEGAKVDHRADLYSLGILLLRTLTKRLPFDVKDTDAVLRWHIRGELPPAIWEGVEVPRYLRELTEKLLRKKAAERFSSARVALHFINLSTVKKYQKFEEDLAVQIPREGPLVERDDLLGALRGRLESAVALEGAAGSFPQICTITGVQGIGKSRIVEEVRRMVQLKEIAFVDLVCNWEVPVWPRIEKWLGAASKVPEGIGEEMQTRLRVDAIIEAARRQPLCFLIDDFQKADRITKALMPALVERLARDRREGRGVPLFILIATEETVKEGLALRRISASGIEEYINLVLGGTEQAAAIAKLLHRYSGGLPLLVVEGLRFLAPRLHKNEPLENMLPPPQIGLLYREKIATLAPAENEFLSALALLFRPARESELASILDLSPTAIARLADACARSDLMGSIPTAEGEERVYQISSQALSLDLIRSIEPARSKELHGRIAAGLTKTPGSPLNEIAYFTAKSGDVDRAIDYYRIAALEFKHRQQIPSATDCLVKALNMCPPQAPLRVDLLKEVSQLLIVSGSYREAEGYLAKIEVADSPAVEEIRGNLAFRQRDFPMAHSHFQRTLELLPPDDRLQRILIENALGNVELQSGQFAQASERFCRTLAEERELPDEKRRQVHNNALGLALALEGKIDEAVAFYEEQMARLTPEMIAEEVSLLSGLGFVLMRASRYDEAIPHLARAVELSEKTGAMHSLFSSIGNLVSALIKEARYADSLPLVKKMGEYQERLGNMRDIAYNLLREGAIYLLVGMEEAAEECFRRGRKYAQEMGDLAMAGWFLLMEGYRQRDFGDLKKSKEIFHATEVEAREQKDAMLAAWVFSAQADLAADMGDYDECERRLGMITASPPDEEFAVRLDLLRAKVAAARRRDTVDALFTKLEAACVGGKLHELLWEVYHSWARAAMDRGERPQAIMLFMKGINTIQAISNALPEEYRDRYLKQHTRKKLFEDFKALSMPETVTVGRKEELGVAAGAGAEGTYADRARAQEVTGGGPAEAGEAADHTVATGPKRAAAPETADATTAFGEKKKT